MNVLNLPAVTTELTLTCSANRAFTATSQEGLLLGTDPSDFGSFLEFLWLFLTKNPATVS